MATVRHIAAWARRTKYQAAWCLLNRVYITTGNWQSLHYLSKPTSVTLRMKARCSSESQNKPTIMHGVITQNKIPATPAMKPWEVKRK